MAGLSGEGCLDAHLNLELLKLSMNVGAFARSLKNPTRRQQHPRA